MLIGDRQTFAIESGMTEVFADKGNFALGFFVIHVGGRRFGVEGSTATMLGNSFDEVEHRLFRRGAHVMPLLGNVDAATIVEAYLDALYRDKSRADYVGLSKQEFCKAIYLSNVIWAPDGDAAFDDGSHVLQFDVKGKVRLIAFVNTEKPIDVAGTIREVWLEVSAFYDALRLWKELLAKERNDRLQQVE